jgi:hypothetical protein
MTTPACPHGHGAMVLKDRGTYTEHQCPTCFCAFVNMSPAMRKQADALNDPEVRQFVNEDHRRRGGVE